MTTDKNIPMAVLSERMKEAIDGRAVRAAVFTTFSFDPDFFELNVLPILFDRSFSQVDKLRHIELEDALKGIQDLAVYYDRSALSQEAKPAQLGYAKIDVSRIGDGVFHPKMVLLLVDEHAEEEEDAKYQSLIVGILSANLTRAGWWENIECAHIEEIKDYNHESRRCPFRKALLSLIDQVQKSTDPDERHPALDRIHDFIVKKTPTGDFLNMSAGGEYYTRVFCGQDQFSKWLEELRLTRSEWNLEIISPYFDHAGAAPLRKLCEMLHPREVRVHLPIGFDEKSQVTPETYKAVAKFARWSKLPGAVTRAGKEQATEKLAPRFVHAKVYRLWHGQGRDLLIVGSVNLTSAAHSHWGAGNLEAAFLVDVTNGSRRWWLEPIEDGKPEFSEHAPEEDEGFEPAPLDLTFLYDWESGELRYRLRGKRKSFEVLQPAGKSLFRVDKPELNRWCVCQSKEAALVREHLISSSFLLIRHAKGDWRVLVREDNMGFRPSLLMQLTPEKILEFWALLTPEQRSAFIAEHGPSGELLEGLPVTRGEKISTMDTLFNRFAGIFHAFGCLRRHIEEAIEEKRFTEAETKLLGAKYDSLPTLLEKCRDRSEEDSVARYVTFLCAKQLRVNLKRNHREFYAETKKAWPRLDAILDKIPEIRTGLLGDDNKEQAFLKWFEPAFLKDLGKS